MWTHWERGGQKVVRRLLFRTRTESRLRFPPQTSDGGEDTNFFVVPPTERTHPVTAGAVPQLVFFSLSFCKAKQASKLRRRYFRRLNLVERGPCGPTTGTCKSLLVGRVRWYLADAVDGVFFRTCDSVRLWCVPVCESALD